MASIPPNPNPASAGPAKSREGDETHSSKKGDNSSEATDDTTSSRPELAKPPFSYDDLAARRAWLWTLAFHTFERQVLQEDKLDTRFTLHLSNLLGLGPEPSEGAKDGRNQVLVDFYENLTVEQFADYKRQAPRR